VLQDSDLTPKELGLLCYLLSFPTNWDVKPGAIARRFGCTRQKVYRLLRRLERKGYATYEKKRRADGTYRGFEWHIHEVPMREDMPATPNNTISSPHIKKPLVDNPLVDNPLVDNPLVDNPEVDNCNTTNIYNTNKKTKTKTQQTNKERCVLLLRELLDRDRVSTAYTYLRKATTDDHEVLFEALEKLIRLKEKMTIRNPMGFIIASWDGERFNIFVEEEKKKKKKENKEDFNKLMEEVTNIGKQAIRTKNKKKFIKRLKDLTKSRYKLIQIRAQEILDWL
jgi:hypothetical protein